MSHYIAISHVDISYMLITRPAANVITHQWWLSAKSFCYGSSISAHYVTEKNPCYCFTMHSEYLCLPDTSAILWLLQNICDTTAELFGCWQTIKRDLLEEIRNIINKKEKGHKNPDKCFNVTDERKNTITELRVQNRCEWDDSRRA